MKPYLWIATLGFLWVHWMWYYPNARFVLEGFWVITLLVCIMGLTSSLVAWVVWRDMEKLFREGSAALLLSLLCISSGDNPKNHIVDPVEPGKPVHNIHRAC